MALGKHTRTNNGTFRKERGDALIKNIKEKYPQLEQFHDSTKLQTLMRDQYGVDSLSLLKKLKYPPFIEGNFGL